MTGFGEARFQDQKRSVGVEVRTVNNRHLKLSAKISEPYGALEPELERLVREKMRRGAVQLNVRVDRPRRAEDYRLNLVALGELSRPAHGIAGHRAGAGDSAVDLSALLTLPGVVEEADGRLRPARGLAGDRPVVTTEALDELEAARAREGHAMAEELQALGRSGRDRAWNGSPTEAPRSCSRTRSG